MTAKVLFDDITWIDKGREAAPCGDRKGIEPLSGETESARHRPKPDVAASVRRYGTAVIRRHGRAGADIAVGLLAGLVAIRVEYEVMHTRAVAD